MSVLFKALLFVFKFGFLCVQEEITKIDFPHWNKDMRLRRCWIILLKGNHDDDPLFLQLKEAQPSVLEPYLQKSIYPNNGQRVVAGQRLIQGAPDIFLGWGEQDPEAVSARD